MTSKTPKNRFSKKATKNVTKTSKTPKGDLEWQVYEDPDMVNNKGQQLYKFVNIYNPKKNGTISFDDINELYHQLLQKYAAKDIMLMAQSLDNSWSTLKSYGYTGDNLKHMDESYYDSIEKKAHRERLLGEYYVVKLEIKLTTDSKKNRKNKKI